MIGEPVNLVASEYQSIDRYRVSPQFLVRIGQSYPHHLGELSAANLLGNRIGPVEIAQAIQSGGKFDV